ncbi:MAG: hypothetical protein MJZ83_00740 [Bacteroidaceae bacterium]|nr:hypothetical protein [Bacteroidaceae bacterium]
MISLFLLQRDSVTVHFYIELQGGTINRNPLDYTQYKKFLQTMNVTLTNYGLNEYVK